jgi:hypothetical protein
MLKLEFPTLLGQETFVSMYVYTTTLNVFLDKKKTHLLIATNYKSVTPSFTQTNMNLTPFR